MGHLDKDLPVRECFRSFDKRILFVNQSLLSRLLIQTRQLLRSAFKAVGKKSKQIPLNPIT